MGQWNGTCALSNLHITDGTDVAVFMLVKQIEPGIFTEAGALYEVMPVPFYAKYCEHGIVEDSTGVGINLLVEGIKSHLYEYGQGSNSVHDIPVSKSTFDLELMLEAESNDRLAVDLDRAFSQDLLSLLSLKQVDKAEINLLHMAEHARLVEAVEADNQTVRPISIALIRLDVLNAILNKWLNNWHNCRSDFSADPDSEGTTFAAIIAEVNQYVDNCKEDPLTAKMPGWLQRERERGIDYAVVNPNDVLKEYATNQDWDGMKSFAREFAVTNWVSEYMLSIRKLWTRQGGVGRPHQDAHGYVLMADTITQILDAEEDNANND